MREADDEPRTDEKKNSKAKTSKGNVKQNAIQMSDEDSNHAQIKFESTKSIKYDLFPR